MNNQDSQSIWGRFSGPNLGYLYDIYEKYKENPESVDQSIKVLFDEFGSPPISEPLTKDSSKQYREGNLRNIISGIKLIENIRTFGHLAADINPLMERPNVETKFLDIETYNLTKEDLLQIPARLIWDNAPSTIQNGWDAYQHLIKVYTKTIAFEFGHIHQEEEQKWLDQHVENTGLSKPISTSEKLDLLDRLLQVDGFEKFLHKTFVGQKRFSIEGVDILVPMLDRIVQSGIEDKLENIMMGMAHRGRLNVLAHVLGKPYELIFSEFHHAPNKELVPSEGSRGINDGWSGDVKYHLGAEREIKGLQEHTIRVNLANNPSHLEFVGPVVLGMTRAAQDQKNSSGYPEQNMNASISVLIHGDAAFPGEGIVAETLNLSKLNGYKTGGTIHIITNNQIGFTTDQEDSRSTRYASDLAKGYEIPIIHVNADDSEACLAVIDFAYQYRKQFQKDIVIDLVGYRRFGHNEMDDPQVTQPFLYKMIDQHPRIAEKYANELLEKNLISKNELDKKINDITNQFQSNFDKIRSGTAQLQKPPVLGPIEAEVSNFDTSVPLERLEKINTNLLVWPETLNVNSKLERILKRRLNALSDKGTVDWALAETLAFATIIEDGIHVRLSGQDSERGTFAHRHLVLHDYLTNEKYIPLHHFSETGAAFSIYNSPLSEAGVLGYEYGYSIQAQDSLVLWEAQFGDFVNAAQVIIDQFISAGRAKWGQKSSLVMLLPHGYEGQGPEHSSGRVERFLTLAAENNWIVANVTSAAQYFHILRRQAMITNRDEARPLIIMTPKSLLRNPRTVSSSNELTAGGFQSLLEQKETGKQPEKVRRLILCTGKIAIDLATTIEEGQAKEYENIHVTRLEQIYPFPKKEILKLIKRFSKLEEIVWVQEEPRNMGPWRYIQAHLIKMGIGNLKLGYIGRPLRSSPATGEPDIHKQEQAGIIQDALSLSKGGDHQ